MQTIEIRPKSARNSILLAIIALLGISGGVASLRAAELLVKGFGLFLLVFFSWLLLYWVPKQLRRDRSFILTPHELQYVSILVGGTTHLPWADVESFRLVNANGLSVGARLKSYDCYLGSVTPAMASSFLKILPFLRVASRAASTFQPHNELAELWTALGGEESKQTEQLKSFGSVGSYAQALQWNRRNYGCDLVWSRGDMDRPVEDFLALLETYRRENTG